MTTAKQLGLGTIGFFVLILLLTLSWESCLSAAREELSYNRQVQQRADRWLQDNQHLDLNSITCNPRTFGSRMPSDPTCCKGMMRTGLRVELKCNLNGCYTTQNNNSD